MNLPKFKIIGSNMQLKAFCYDCLLDGIPVSKANSFFRDDREHCLMPCYAYDDKQPENTKLQTIESGVYKMDLVFDLDTEYDVAMKLCAAIKEANDN